MALGLAMLSLFVQLFSLGRSREQQRGPWSIACEAHPELTWCNASLPTAARVEAAIAAMTLGEKLSQMSTFTPQVQPGIPRLAFEDYGYHSEGLHGLRGTQNIGKPATVFPQVSAMAATGNLSMIRAMAEVMRTEARAANSEMLRKGTGPFGNGGSLFFWSPTLNIYRDPRWGRGQESISEDPWLNGAYSVVFLKEFQREDQAGYPATAATCKHYLAYSLEGRGHTGQTRHNFNAVVAPRDLAETYLPPFQRCVVEGKPAQVMCSYNAINGVPACVDKAFLTDTLRSTWGFEGLTVSDQGAIADILNGTSGTDQGHRYARDWAHAIADAINAGCDMNDQSFYSKHGASAVEAGLVTHSRLDEALRRILTQRFRVGSFDSPHQVPSTNTPVDVMGSPEHAEIALAAAREAIVLLNNSEGVLPLASADIAGRTVALVGVGSLIANSTALAGGKTDYHASHYVTLVEGLASRELFQSGRSTLTFRQGCANTLCQTADIASVVSSASEAAVTVAVVGIDGLIEREQQDRVLIGLPGQQESMLVALKAACLKANSKLIVVLMNGGSLSADWVRSNVATVLDAFEGGQAAGTALAEVLFGDVNPSGVLPFTVYPSSYVDSVAVGDMSMRANSLGRTYRFYRGAPLWAFGEGGSYTTWSLRWLDFPIADQSSGAVHMSAEIQNTGSRAGSRVVMAFVNFEGSSDSSSPKKSLWGMQKIFLAPGSLQIINFSAAIVPKLPDDVWCTFCSVDDSGARQVKLGKYRIYLGGDGRLSDAALFDINGQRIDGVDEITAVFSLNGDAPFSVPLLAPVQPPRDSTAATVYV